MQTRMRHGPPLHALYGETLFLTQASGRAKYKNCYIVSGSSFITMRLMFRGQQSSKGKRGTEICSLQGVGFRPEAFPVTGCKLAHPQMLRCRKC